VFNPRTDSTVLPAAAAFYLSSDEIWDESDRFLEYADIPVLGGNEATPVRFSVKLEQGLTASGQFVIAVLDAFDVVPEVNEENNIVVSSPIP